MLGERVTMELENLLRPIRRWWWLIAVSGLLAAAASYYATERQPDIYSSRTTLMVGSTISSLNPTNNDFQLARQLAGLYADIARRDPVRNSTAQALGLDGLPAYNISVPGGGQLIEISVVDTDPVRAQAVANELANQLIARLPENDSSSDPERARFAEEQLVYLEERIRETQEDIERTQIDLAELTSAEQIADTQVQLNALQSKLSTLQANYAAFLSTSSSDSVNTINVIEPADLPSQPVNSNRWLYVALSSTLGLALGVSAAFLMEYLDRSLKSVEEVLQIADMPVLARLPKDALPKDLTGRHSRLFEEKQSLGFEAFRILRTNLEFESDESSLRSILIVSPEAGDGKSTVAANLGLAYSRAGNRTVVVDADFRNPDIHDIFGLPNFQGFAHLVAARRTQQTVLQATGVGQHLWAIPAGPSSFSGREALSTVRMRQLLDDLNEEFDKVIIDSPPSVLSDAALLASVVDGVILVVRLDNTIGKNLEASIEQLLHAHANVLGFFINGIPRTDAYGYGYGYLGYWGEHDKVESSEPNGRGRLTSAGKRIRALFKQTERESDS